MPKDSNRMNKVNEELKKEISVVISQELKDPHLTGLISVTKVDTTPDLRFARVYVSMIKKCSGFIRSMIAKRVNLRTTPELIFLFDESIEYGSRIDSILEKITKDMKKD